MQEGARYIRESTEGEEQVPGEVPGSTPPGLGLAGVMRIWVFIQREEWKALERLYSGQGKVRGSG